MTEIHRILSVPYSASSMFDLVHDVESYPNYLPWCSQVQVLRKEANWWHVGVSIDFNGIASYFETCNKFEYGSVIEMQLISGPFEKLEGSWLFCESINGGSLVEFRLLYKFKYGPFSLFIEPFFNYISRTLMDLFVKQAKIYYGKD